MYVGEITITELKMWKSGSVLTSVNFRRNVLNNISGRPNPNIYKHNWKKIKITAVNTGGGGGPNLTLIILN